MRYAWTLLRTISAAWNHEDGAIEHPMKSKNCMTESRKWWLLLLSSLCYFYRVPLCVVPTPGNNLSPAHIEWQGLHGCLNKMSGPQIMQSNETPSSKYHHSWWLSCSSSPSLFMAQGNNTWRPCLNFHLKPTWFQGNKVCSKELLPLCIIIKLEKGYEYKKISPLHVSAA